MVKKNGETKDINLQNALEQVHRGSTIKERADGVKNVKTIFSKAQNLSILDDKAYHKIFEDLFRAVLAEKQTYLSTKKTTKSTATSRLQACAEVFRTIVGAGASKLRAKTVEAVIDHITQALPNADGEYCEPIVQNYLKALSEILQHSANVERLKPSTWVDTVDFCLDGVNHYLDDTEGGPSGLSLRTSGLGTSRLSESLPSSTIGNGRARIRNSSVSRQNVDDLLQILSSLVSAPNASLLERSHEVMNTILRFLKSQSSTISELHQKAFSILNAVLSCIREDQTLVSKGVAQEVIPIICRFWQGKSVAKDKMLGSVREEMLVLLFLVHLHLESSVIDDKNIILALSLSDLLDVVRAEYARREERDQLHLDDLDMTDLGAVTIDKTPFRLHDFLLRPYNIQAERNWANLKVIGILERLVGIGAQRGTSPSDTVDNDADKHPRKRQRTTRSLDRLLDPLKSEDQDVRLSGLQMVPFILQEVQLSDFAFVELLDQLSVCAYDKRGAVASWALLAIASCTHQNAAATNTTVDWTQFWHIGARALTFSATCRAASIQLHAILATGRVQYHEIGEDLNAMITAADVSGPVVLCDSGIFLMIHLLNARVTEVPGASHTACYHVVRWLLSRWNPADKTFATHSAVQIRPYYLVDLLRTSLGLPRLTMPISATVTCGTVAQAWQLHLMTQDVMRYLLLLDDQAPEPVPPHCSSCPSHSSTNNRFHVLDTGHFQSTRKLILELITPKSSDLLQAWKSYNEDGSSPVSTDTFRRAINAVIIFLLLMPHFADIGSPVLRVFQADMQSLIGEVLSFVNGSETSDSKGNQTVVEILLQSIQPYLPSCGSNDFTYLSNGTPHLLQFFTMTAEMLNRRRLNLAPSSAVDEDDSMDLDNDFSPQRSHGRTEGQKFAMPRQDLALDVGFGSFYLIATGRLLLLAAMSDTPNVSGFIPSTFIDQLVSMTDEELLSCRRLLSELLCSDLIIDEEDATRLVEKLGGILSSDEYDRCEIAIGICLDVLAGLGPMWVTMDGRPLAESAFQLYGWFINKALHKDIASPAVQKGIAKLLLLLLRSEDQYGVALSLPSPRSSLFHILRNGNTSVKFYIAGELPAIFDLFTLKAHDDVFVDILESLPHDPDRIEGIAFRLFVLAKLASKWATLLRRCIYHIFETPGRIPESLNHATRCLINVSSELNVDSPRELFKLFAPQLLYTWLETEDIEDLPFQIFGYSHLKELVADGHEEAAALMVMRGQEEAVVGLAKMLGLTEAKLVMSCFTKVMAYTIAYDISVRPPGTPKKHVTGEARVRKHLGRELFLECINLHFAEVVALLFNVIDHGDIEKHFMKIDELAYAGKILKEIKDISSSQVVLPANQQPTFRAKYLTSEIQHLCSRTEYEPSNIYTPALVTFVARKLLGTIHPALGSLHSCSVLRKLRILISLSGKAAIDGYPLEMLLHSIRPFITDPECADDAIGIVQYLIARGSSHLSNSPSFVAGIAISVFGSLRVFLQSTPASTTQESQYKETMSKAHTFHAWMGNYVHDYRSSALSDQSKSNFRALVQSAYKIGSVGNAEIGTAESDLLFRLLKDEQTGGTLLSRPSRELAFQMLCSEFEIPASFRTDLFGSDDLAIDYAAVVWKSCKVESASKQYLSWAARVLGRAFAASGHIHQELLQESNLSQIKSISSSLETDGSSEACILGLLQALTLGHDRRTVGLAESALRVIVSTSNGDLLQICQQSLSMPLKGASLWQPYHIPPSETSYNHESVKVDEYAFATDAISQPRWLHDLTAFLARSLPDDPLLPALVPIIGEIPGFADRAFPFILHLVLSMSSQGQSSLKKKLSSAFTSWLSESNSSAKDNLKMLINSLLYLRTQPLSQEKSSADRSHWLDIDYLQASKAATNSGMFKTALLFLEEFYSESGPSKSRRSSAISHSPQEIPTELLLHIFENIDDPDLYYGVQQSASLSTIQARLEYEKDGPKSLAFRGAQYDSHVRKHAPESAQDVQSLVNALDVLSLSGLSHSLLQAQQTVGMSSTSLESMFRTARKLEQWDIPVPSTCNNNSVTIYKAFQAVTTALDYTTILRAINEGLDCTMTSLIREDLGASALHGSLQTLAALVEMDEVLCSQGSELFEEMILRFRNRQEWMKIGRFDDINQILSCRGTTLSTLSREPRLHKIINIEAVDTRMVEVHTALLASELSRAHNALQESLSLATSLIDLIPSCRNVNLNLDVAIHLEAANALWDQGEMTSSIGMLQGLEKDKESLLKKQDIPIGRSKLLSKIGSQVSVARLEKPDRILENYLKPALNELKGKNKGIEAGEVFHQFAVFCDQQLQDADGLEDLERLKKLSKMKGDEVRELTKILDTSTSNTEKNRVKGHLSKAKTWLKLDEEELQRQIASRDEFLCQSLENYLLALIASDEHDKKALRFSALWLEHSETYLANDAVSKHLAQVASRKFAPLMNQLTSRLQDTTATFQQLLFSLVLRIATDHPFHGMYQIYASASGRANSKDETAVLRHAAAVKLSKRLAIHEKAGQIWTSITATNKVYCQLAAEKDDQKYKSGRRVALKDSPAGSRLNSSLVKYRIPSPTMQIDLAADLDYSKVPVMIRFEATMSIASGVSAPKIITALADDGAKFKQLVKGGNDDLRQDAIMEQVFEQVSELLKTNRSTRQRNLSIRTYKVLPLTSIAGIIEFVPNTIPLHEYLMPAHERYYPKDLKGNQCRKEIGDVQTQSHKVRVEKFRTVTEKFHPVMRYFFTEKFTDPDEWFVKRLAYTRSTAAISILGHVLGLGDRHGHNILLDAQSGEVVHIDLGVAFEMGRVLPVPELVPFRLTRDIVDGMGITKTEGVFRRCCEFTLEALRKEIYSIMTILDVLRYDPLYSWSISPVRLAKLQEGQSAAAEQEGGAVHERTKEVVNEPGEADRALTVVNKKLSKTLSVTATVNDLINQASDPNNLAVLYSGWAAYA